MRKKLKSKPKTNSIGDAIAEHLHGRTIEPLPSLEGSLDPRRRRRISPDEEAEWANYSRWFNQLKKAVRSQKARRALFELDSAVGGVIEAQAQVSRVIGHAMGVMEARR